jgi:hypothetical protein
MELDEDLPMYCCLPLSYAVKYGIITINMERVEVKLSLKSTLSESEKKEIWNGMYKAHIKNIHPDYIQIVHCPWCGVHMNTVIDFDKGIHAGQYSSKKGWER